MFTYLDTIPAMVFFLQRVISLTGRTGLLVILKCLILPLDQFLCAITALKESTRATLPMNLSYLACIMIVMEQGLREHGDWNHNLDSNVVKNHRWFLSTVNIHRNLTDFCAY